MASLEINPRIAAKIPFPQSLMLEKMFMSKKHIISSTLTQEGQ